ncbi:glycosyltransferase family 2 protein [Cytobacillus sp. BC1816]|uniref:glycosyltransferase family 2 protein n=1 Tax=Cytobacillus sp. BC1816 TaxID=3440154 RepID=UPI003F50FA15
MNKKVVIVIPVFNRINDTLICLQNLYRQTYSNFEIVICDDKSSDGTYEQVSKRYPEVHLVKGNGHLWWTGGTNKAIEFAINKINDIDYFLTLNNDVKINQDFLENLVAAIENNPKSLVCAVSLTEENEPKIFFGGCKKLSWKSAKYKMHYKPGTLFNEKKHIGILESDYLIGRGLLFPAKLINEIGLFNFESLPQYFSDSDFSLRAKRAGYKLLVDFKSKVYTIPNETTKEFIENNTIKYKLFNRRSPQHFKSRLLFAKLNCPPMLLPSFIIADFFRIVGSHILTKRKMKGGI